MSLQPPQGNLGRSFRRAPSDFAPGIRNAEALLGIASHIPLRYWQPAMLFTGAADRGLHRLTGGLFPAGSPTYKKRPVFALKSLPHTSGFKVCPCSTKKPYNQVDPRFIRSACALRPTGHRLKRNSYLVEKITFNIPPSMALSVRFLGIVPDECLERGQSTPQENDAE